MAYELQTLSHVHMAMIELCLNGESCEAIAALTRRSVIGVRGIINSPLFQDALARRRQQQTKKIDETQGSKLAAAKQILEDSAETAAKVQVDLLSYPDPRVRQTAVSEIFNRTFGRGSAADVQQGSSISVVLGPQAILNLQIALAEDRDSGDVITDTKQLVSTGLEEKAE